MLKHICKWYDCAILLENVTSWVCLFWSGLNGTMFAQICFSDLSLIHKLTFWQQKIMYHPQAV